MKPKASIETSIVSYLTAWQSRDLVLAAHQQVTRDWWASRGNFELFASQFVFDEAAAGDEDAAASRLAALAETAVLEVTEDAILLAEKLIAGGGLPSHARVDALHVAMAALSSPIVRTVVLQFWQMSHTLTVRLTGDLAEWLEQTAAGTGQSQGQIVRDQLDRARAEAAGRAFMRLAGTVRGPKDLSSRKGFSRP